MNDYLSSSLLSKYNSISHRFYTRSWGISRNNEQRKKEELERLSCLLTDNKSSLITLSQVHSSRVIIVDAPLAAIPEADALITKQPGLFLGVFSADCVPIVLAAQDGSLVAAIHAGWRGAVGTIIEECVAIMHSMSNAPLYAALGPCIWQASYEVAQDVYDRIACADHRQQFFVPAERTAHWYFDLPGYVSAKLKKAGVKEIDASPANTYSDENFFSFRRYTHNAHEDFKSNISVIGII